MISLKHVYIVMELCGNGGGEKDFFEFMSKRRFFIEEEIIDYFL